MDKMKAYMCDNCGQIAMAASWGADCPCGGTYSMDPPTVKQLPRRQMTATQAKSWMASLDWGPLPPLN
jgi:hypothetical protein